MRKSVRHHGPRRVTSCFCCHITFSLSRSFYSRSIRLSQRVPPLLLEAQRGLINYDAASVARPTTELALTEWKNCLLLLSVLLIALTTPLPGHLMYPKRTGHVRCSQLRCCCMFCAGLSSDVLCFEARVTCEEEYRSFVQ